ncbi:FecR domain-containing protein [Bordetella petrii]|nr:FecR domain-containing protein [Bordetella petrii]
MESSASLDSAVVREAARWLVLLHSGEAGPQDYADFQRWRQASPDRELAWQRAERLSQWFGAVPPELGVPVLTRQAGVNRRAVIKALAALGVALPAAWLAYRHGPWGSAGTYRTAVGESRKIVLADGSRVQMNTGTDVDVLYSGDARAVRLRRGEIYVQTAPDIQGMARPFLIDTDQGRLRALGTRFTVRQLEGGQAGTQLSVLEHRVEITLRDGGARKIVGAGQQIRFSGAAFEAAGPIGRAPGTAGIEPPGWTRGTLQADDMRLDAFMAELSRYRPGFIRTDPQVAGLRVSGVFRLDDTDHVLAVVRETLPVRIVQRTPYWVTVAARAP